MRPPPSPARGNAPASSTIPRLALALTLLAPALLPAGGCQCSSPSSSPAPAGSVAPATSAAPSASALTPGPYAPLAEPEPPRFVGASQILIAYKGAELAPPTVTRTKEDARKRAEEALAKLTEGKSSLEELAKTWSDDVSKVAGGAMGNFERSAVPPALADAAFALQVGQTSGIIETARGFHILRRTR